MTELNSGHLYPLSLLTLTYSDTNLGGEILIDIVDLHTHSTFSDGTFTPTELVMYAKEKGIKAIALTDHDTIEGLEEGANAAQKEGIEFINGIEYAVDCVGCEIHVLGLCIDRHSKYLQDEIVKLKETRHARNLKMLKKLNESGINITLEDIRGTQENAVITRANFARAIVEKGYVQSHDGAFKKYLSKGRKTYIERERLEAKTAIETVEKSGGLSFLAHPFLYNLAPKDIEKLIEELVSQGLNGIEAYHVSHSQYNIDILLKIAQKYNLLVCGGSDFHGANKEGVDLGVGRGNVFVKYEVLSKIKDEIGKMKGKSN